MTTRYPSVYIDRLGRQIALWEQYGLSDSRAMKLLHLWIGYKMTRFMDSQGRYTFHSFNQLRQQLGYKTVQMMFDDLRRSRSFVLLSCDIDPAVLKDQNFFAAQRPGREYPDNITAFFSPLWHELTEADGEPLEGSMAECRVCSRKCDGKDNNALDNNTLTGGTADAVEAGRSASVNRESLTLQEVEALEREEVLEAIARAKTYFRGLVRNPDARQREPIDFITWKLQQPQNAPRGKVKGYGLTLEEAYEVLDIMIDKELAPHFARDKSFNSPAKVAKPENHIYQVTPYVKNYSSDMMARAFKKWKKRLADRHRDASRREAEKVRQNRPISPHEWQDSDGMRWMEDHKGNLISIPAEAPPRPSVDSIWNFISNSWS